MSGSLSCSTTQFTAASKLALPVSKIHRHEQLDVMSFIDETERNLAEITRWSTVNIQNWELTSYYIGQSRLGNVEKAIGGHSAPDPPPPSPPS